MVHTLSRAALVLGLGVLVGLALGLIVGWKVWPVRYVNVTPADLAPSIKDDYAIMISASYARTGDLTTAMKQLNSLGYGLADVESLARTGTERGLALHQTQLLAQLAKVLAGEVQSDMKSPTPVLLPATPSSRRSDDGGLYLYSRYTHPMAFYCHVGILLPG